MSDVQTFFISKLNPTRLEYWLPYVTMVEVSFGYLDVVARPLFHELVLDLLQFSGAGQQTADVSRNPVYVVHQADLN